jgi:DNA polymerase-1
VFAAWRQQCLAEAQRTGSAWTYWDGERARRRPLWGIADPNDGIRGNCERSAYNTPVQGSASDYCLRSIPSIVRLCRESYDERAKLVLTVHDSVLLEVPEGEVDSVAVAVKTIMESWPSGPVPLVVDFKVGQSWGTMGGYICPSS